MAWEPAEFLIADLWSNPGFHKVAGYTYRGLGIHLTIKGSPKGRRPPTWSLSHLGSGHKVCLIDGKVATAFEIASEIADCGDWSFDGLKGYINIDPDIKEKFRALCEKHPKTIRRGPGGNASEDAARAIVMARA